MINLFIQHWLSDKDTYLGIFGTSFLMISGQTVLSLLGIVSVFLTIIHSILKIINEYKKVKNNNESDSND